MYIISIVAFLEKNYNKWVYLRFKCVFIELLFYSYLLDVKWETINFIFILSESKKFNFEFSEFSMIQILNYPRVNFPCF